MQGQHQGCLQQGLCSGAQQRRPRQQGCGGNKRENGLVLSPQVPLPLQAAQGYPRGRRVSLCGSAATGGTPPADPEPQPSGQVRTAAQCLHVVRLTVFAMLLPGRGTWLASCISHASNNGRGTALTTTLAPEPAPRPALPCLPASPAGAHRRASEGVFRGNEPRECRCRPAATAGLPQRPPRQQRCRWRHHFRGPRASAQPARQRHFRRPRATARPAGEDGCAGLASRIASLEGREHDS